MWQHVAEAPKMIMRVWLLYAHNARDHQTGTHQHRGILLILVILGPGQPGGQPLDRRLVLGVKVDELGQLLGQPAQRHVFGAAPPAPSSRWPALRFSARS